MEKERGARIIVVGGNNDIKIIEDTTIKGCAKDLIEHTSKEVEELKLTLTKNYDLPKEYLTGQEKRRLRRKNKLK